MRIVWFHALIRTSDDTDVYNVMFKKPWGHKMCSTLTEMNVFVWFSMCADTMYAKAVQNTLKMMPYFICLISFWKFVSLSSVEHAFQLILCRMLTQPQLKRSVDVLRTPWIQRFSLCCCQKMLLSLGLRQRSCWDGRADPRQRMALFANRKKIQHLKNYFVSKDSQNDVALSPDGTFL